MVGPLNRSGGNSKNQIEKYSVCLFQGFPGSPFAWRIKSVFAEIPKVLLSTINIFCTYVGHLYSVSGSSFTNRSWFLAHDVQWPALFHSLFGMGSSQRWHSTALGPQQKSKQQERKNQNRTTAVNTSTQSRMGSSRSFHGSSSGSDSTSVRNKL